MNDTKTTNDLVNELRGISKAIRQRNANMLFPSLYPAPAENVGPEFIDEPVPLISEALDTIRRGGRLDAARVSALVHYIADMMEE